MKTEKMKEAILIGYSKLFSMKGKETLLWSCIFCNKLFNSQKESCGKEVTCPTCRKQIKLPKEEEVKK